MQYIGFDTKDLVLYIDWSDGPIKTTYILHLKTIILYIITAKYFFRWLKKLYFLKFYSEEKKTKYFTIYRLKCLHVLASHHQSAFY